MCLCPCYTSHPRHTTGRKMHNPISTPCPSIYKYPLLLSPPDISPFPPSPQPAPTCNYPHCKTLLPTSLIMLGTRSNSRFYSGKSKRVTGPNFTEVLRNVQLVEPNVSVLGLPSPLSSCGIGVLWV